MPKSERPKNCDTKFSKKKATLKPMKTGEGYESDTDEDYDKDGDPKSAQAVCY